ncbi:acyl-CoA binding protein [Talaromyces pinophilus]|uniref:Acyl-CoA binding protein n=1 Tax=Talaromyces pinophilus TaxID=128442 RepID=A0A0B8MXH5_TALPI|nr:acyl-CoA binding protein [Talaromyces pinophilus]
MSDSVDRVFVHALNTVKKIPRTGTARPPAAERLKLYGLYKQSMEGDVEGIMDRPIGDAPDVQAEREKWDAWYSQRGSSRTEAKRRYITTLINTMHLYASQTAEARELVAELEFVWDQIKYNAASSSTSSSSPIQATRTLPSVSVSAAASAPRRYGSIDDRMTRSPAADVEDQDEDLAIYRRRSGDSRLRVLSPVSQSDEAEVRSHRHAIEGHDDDDEDEDDQDDEEDDFQEARTGTSFSDTSHHDANIEEDAANHRTRKKRKRRPSHSQSKDWRHRIEQALTKMTTEIAALREQLDSLPITHHSHSHSLRRPSNFFAWLLSWGKWFLFHTLRQLLWQSIILSVVLVWLRARGDTRLERRVVAILLQLRRRMMNAIQSVPRRLPKLLHLPLL